MDAAEQYCLSPNIPPAHRHGDAAAADTTLPTGQQSQTEKFLISVAGVHVWVCTRMCVLHTVGLSIVSVLS